MKPTEGYCETSSVYPLTHDTAKQECPVCNKQLGYDVPLLSYGVDVIIHKHCQDEFEEMISYGI